MNHRGAFTFHEPPEASGWNREQHEQAPERPHRRVPDKLPQVPERLRANERIVLSERHGKGPSPEIHPHTGDANTALQLLHAHNEVPRHVVQIRREVPSGAAEHHAATAVPKR